METLPELYTDPQIDLVLYGKFNFRGVLSDYTVHFNNDTVEIKTEGYIKKISYTHIEKIKYNSKTLKLFLKNDEKLVIPCNSNDIAQIKKLFRIAERTNTQTNACAAVSIANYSFFVQIDSTDINEFKKKILQRISKKFYPACEMDVEVEMFHNFIFFAVGDDISVELRHSKDLEAALIYFDNKLRINIEEK